MRWSLTRINRVRLQATGGKAGAGHPMGMDQTPVARCTPDDEPERELEEERRLLGTETEQEEIEHGRPIDPLETPIAPLLVPSRSTLIGSKEGLGQAIAPTVIYPVDWMKRRPCLVG